MGFKGSALPAMIVLWPIGQRIRRARSGEIVMHDLLIALAFVGMVIAPAIVAAKVDSGSAMDEAE